MNTSNLIISNPEILGGKPVFKGTRVPVSNLIEYIESGYTLDDFLNGFPTVKRTQVIQVLKLLSENIQLSAKTHNTSRRAFRRKAQTAI